METKVSNIKKCGGAARDKKISFLSDNRELNAAISRYFKHVHKIPITTFHIPLTPPPLTNNHSTTPPLHHSTNNPSPLTNILVVQNEVEINSSICGIYPFWFDYGIRNNIFVYGFTYENTDLQNNLLDWQSFLGLQWLDHYQDTIDHEKVPYFDSTRGSLYGVLKPHGGDSLYDLATGIHMTFANASQYIARLKSSGNRVPAKFKPDIIEPGIARFQKFLEKEPRHRSFLSVLPEADRLFVAIKELGYLLDEFEGTDFQGTDTMETLCRLLPLIQAQTSFIHSFFLNLEPFISGGIQ